MMMVGSLNTYTKNLKMQTQFQLKQSRGELGSHKTLEEYLNASAEENSGFHDNSDDKLQKIERKLDAGAKLTAEERRYLKEKDPEAYAKMEATEREQKAFEQKLRQCRTKEEAQRLKMSYLNSSLVIVKAVEHNPNIGISEKLKIMMQEKRRCDKIEQSAQEFVREGGYAQLPTEAEQAKAEKDAKKAQEPGAQVTPETPDQKKAREEDGEQEKEKIHVESREERKVKRARAQARASARGNAADFAAAVTAYHTAAQTTVDVPQPTVDVTG